MQLVNKPDYSYITTSFELENIKLFYLSRQLGIASEDLLSAYPSPPDFHLLQKISAYFPVNANRMIFMNQVHGDEVIHKTNKKPSFPTADSIITNQTNLALCLKTADCVPIFLYDPKNFVIAAVHAGWRGTALKLVKKTIKKLEHFYATDPENLYAFIGPSIGACCYKVGRDVFDNFHFLGKNRQDFFGKLKGDRYMMDIKSINAFMLEQSGVLQENIEVANFCTCCEEKLFHSYRRDAETSGRNISFITLL